MNTQRSVRGNYPPRNQRGLAIVAAGVGVGLLVFGAPAGLPPLSGPGALWTLAAILCIVFGLVSVVEGFDRKREPDRETTVVSPPPKANDLACEGIEAKLRELLRSKEGKLISEDEYQRNRADLLEKW